MKEGENVWSEEAANCRTPAHVSTTQVSRHSCPANDMCSYLYSAGKALTVGGT
jgi:hypothetical protein